MLRTPPNDGRMLLERPIREALRLYAFQLAGLLIIVNFFVCIFAVVFCVERLGIVAHDYTVYSTSTSSSPAWLIGAIGLLLIVVSLAAMVRASQRIMQLFRTAELAADDGKRRASNAIRYLDAAINAYNEQDFDEAKRRGQASLTAFERLGDPAGIAEANMVLGSTFLQMEDYNLAYASSGFRQYTAAADEGRTGRALSLLGDIALAEEKFAEAEEYYRESLTHMRWSHDNWDIVTTTLNRADALEALGQPSAADDLRQKARGIIRREIEQGTPRKRVPLAPRHASISRDPVKAG